MPYDLKAASSLAFTERKEPEQVKLAKPGELFVGVLLTIQTVQMTDGPASKAIFEMPNGERKFMFLSAQLKMRISKNDAGHFVQIRYEGDDTNVGKDKGNAMKLYRVVVSDVKVPGFTDEHLSEEDYSAF